MSEAGYTKPKHKKVRKDGQLRDVDTRFVNSKNQPDVPPGSFLPENNGWRTGPVRQRPNVSEMAQEVVDFKANNKLPSARDLFNNKKAYNDKAYEGLYMNQVKKNTIDLWEGKALYGKVNFDGIAVFPNEYYLRQFRSTRKKETIFGLNFVVDAFEAMRQYVAKRKVELANNNFNLSPQESERLTPTCVRSWDSPRRQYEAYFAQLYSIFYNNALQRRKSQVFTFEDFMEAFYEFVDIITPDLPLTFSGWYTSLNAGHNLTGLTVDLFDIDPDDDLSKQRYFLNSQHFKLISSAAEQHGFLIDKNIPWRLVVNLNSKRMKKYMLRRGIPMTQEIRSDLFDNMYERADRYDIEFIRVAVAKMWENFVAQEPQASVNYLCGTVNEYSNVRVTKQLLIDRTQTNSFNENNLLRKDSYYYKNYNDLHWLRLYYYIRAKEKNKLITIDSLDRSIGGVYNEYKRSGILSAMQKVNSELA